MNTSQKPPPIFEAIKLLNDIKSEINSLKMEVIHIKNYIRKEEIRKLAEETEKEKEYQEVEKRWWW
jgi:predicted RNA-binding protein with EMAP domain